jgi:putative ABC transport system permease protein
MFFVAGTFMVLFATLIAVWNLDLVVSLVSVLGRSAPRWLPAIQTAVAYPMASRGRTGMTIAMFSLVIFSVVTLPTISANFTAALLTDDAGAGWDVRVTANPSNPITDLDAGLTESGVERPAISATGRVETLDGSRGRLRNEGEAVWTAYPINGMDTTFIDGSTIPLVARAPGYDSDEAVWQAVRAGENVAVIDIAAFEADGFGSDDDERYLTPDGVAIASGSLPAFEVEMLDPRTAITERFTVIGVISSRVSLLRGVFIGEQPFADLYGGGEVTTFYVQTDADAGDVADGIESALRTRGVQAEAIDDMLEDMQSSAVSFFTLIQGFMALGLVVGIAALGVISFRSVVERRQQIGMLRAIGFDQRMVGVAFVVESLVVAAIGVLSGAALALLLSYNLVMGGGFGDSTQFDRFVVPWGYVAFFVVAALVAAALMTWIPARQASRVPIAEALRYE